MEATDRAPDKSTDAPEDDQTPENEKIKTDEHILQLTASFLNMYSPGLALVSSGLQEVQRSQMVLLDSLSQENARYQDKPPLDAILARAKHYQQRLTAIRKEMAFLHEKSTKLKKRGLKLLEQKQKEALQREQQRERELERDRLLTPKLNVPQPPS